MERLKDTYRKIQRSKSKEITLTGR